LYEWRNRLGISTAHAANLLGLSDLRYKFYEVCFTPKAIKIAAVYIELVHMTADEYIKHLKVKYPHHHNHNVARPFVVTGLLKGYNPTSESISILLLPKQSIKFIK